MTRFITIRLIGGPLDGVVRREPIPEHWDAVRYEHQTETSSHVYWGEIAGDTVVLEHVSYEPREVER